MESARREMRAMWVDKDEVRGGRYVKAGQLTTLWDEVGEFALRRHDGGEPVPAGTVVRVLETRPYGSLLVTEVPDGDTVLRGIDRIRRELRKIEQAPGYVRDEYREEIARLNALVDRFPEPTEWVEA